MTSANCCGWMCNCAHARRVRVLWVFACVGVATHRQCVSCVLCMCVERATCVCVCVVYVVIYQSFCVLPSPVLNKKPCLFSGQDSGRGKPYPRELQPLLFGPPGSLPGKPTRGVFVAPALSVPSKAAGSLGVGELLRGCGQPQDPAGDGVRGVLKHGPGGRRRQGRAGAGDRDPAQRSTATKSSNSFPHQGAPWSLLSGAPRDVTSFCQRGNFHLLWKKFIV